MTEAQDLYDAMLREDDDDKRAELRRQYVEKIRAGNREALAKMRGHERSFTDSSARLRRSARQRARQFHGLQVSVRWLWIIVAIDTAALFVMAVNR